MFIIGIFTSKYINFFNTKDKTKGKKFSSKTTACNKFCLPCLVMSASSRVYPMPGFQVCDLGQVIKYLSASYSISENGIIIVPIH